MTKKKPLDPMTVAPIHQVLSDLNIQPDEWDVLLIGDGSGTDWKNSCGFSAVLIDHYGNYRIEFHGGLSAGTSQLAELFPYMHAMTWYASGPGQLKLKDKVHMTAVNSVKIHVITDNRNLANQGNGLAQRKAYSWLWKTFDELTGMGYEFKWHWMERMKLGLNRVVDYLSSRCRKDIEKIELPPGMSVYDFNPAFISQDLPEVEPAQQGSTEITKQVELKVET